MILASHIVISGLLGAKTGNYFLAATIGFISHYILDAIPHWDYLSEEFESKAQGNPGFIKNKKFWREISKVALDILIGLILLFALIKLSKSPNITSMLFAVFFSILPDPLGLLYWMTGWKIIKWNSDIQDFMHYSIHAKIKPGFWLGILTQILAVMVTFLILYGFLN